ncbi:MAG TPA: TIGR03435 family protein [Edaphobacter sp.]|nr:TIGR03435 family protein [Edaphobacter sp.]
MLRVFIVFALLSPLGMCAQTDHAVAAAAREQGGEHLSFEVSTIKPSKSETWRMFFTTDGFISSGVTLQMLVQEAFGAYAGDYVTGGPTWVTQAHYDVVAKLSPEEIPQFRDLSLAQRRAMLQALLVDRFHLSTHREEHLRRGYAIRVAKGGPKLIGAEAGAGHMDGVSGYDCTVGGRGAILGDIRLKNCSMQDLSSILSGTVAPKIVDQTGLKGRYNFDLHWTPDEREKFGTSAAGEPTAASSSEFPGLLTAIKEQLGLALVPTNVPVEAVVIDHAEYPANN